MKNSKLPLPLRFLIVCISLLFIISCEDDDSNDNNTEIPNIVIGGIAPLSGDAAIYGRIDKLVSDMIFDEINANGGINGREIEVIWRDTKCDPALAEVEVQSLINAGISIILGDGCSGSTLAAAPITEANNVILFTSISTNAGIKDAGDFVFRTAASDETVAEALGAYANENFAKVGIITEETDYAEGLTIRFLEIYTGSSVDLRFPTSQTDFESEVEQMVTDNVDAILIMPQTPAKTRLIVEELVEIVWNKDVFGNESLYIDEEIVADYNSEFALWNCVSANFVPPSSSALDDLVDDFQLEYGEELTLLNYAAPTVDRDQILIQVLEDIGDETNTEAIRDALYNISNYEGLSGTFSFDEDGEVDLVATLLIFDGESFVPEQ